MPDGSEKLTGKARYSAGVAIETPRQRVRVKVNR